MSISEQNLGAGSGGQVRRRRRRQWSEAQKRQIVAEAHELGISFGAFSNFQPLAVPLAAGPWTFRSAESLYQAAKFAQRPDIQQRIAEAPIARETSVIGRTPGLGIDPHWNAQRVDVMRWVLHMKREANSAEIDAVLAANNRAQVTPVRFLQGIEVSRLLQYGDHRCRLASPGEDMAHEQPRRAAVPVFERVDLHEPVVQPCGFEWCREAPGALVLAVHPDQSFHLARRVLWRTIRVLRRTILVTAVEPPYCTGHAPYEPSVTSAPAARRSRRTSNSWVVCRS